MKKTQCFSILMLAAAASGAAVPVEWDVEVTRVQPAMFSAYRGETLELSARMLRGGRPFEVPLEGAALYWQTNGMGSAYWAASASCASNVLSAVWSPTNDVGAATYNCFIGEPGGSYRAAFRLRLLDSPGASPNSFPLPVARLDFAAVEVANAPYYDKAETEAKIVELAPAPGDYETVSNRAMNAVQTEADPVWNAEKSGYAKKADLAGKASKSDATLTERRFSAWGYDYSDGQTSQGPLVLVWSTRANAWNPTIQKIIGAMKEATGNVMTWAAGEWIGGVELVATRTESGWTCSPAEYDQSPIGIMGDVGSDVNPYIEVQASTTLGNASSTILDIDIVQHFGPDAGYGVIHATRTALSGYQLGSQADKPLASEAEAEALRTAVAGKQDNLPYPTNAIPYAAISGKPTNVSAFENDAGYLTGYTESDPTIKAWAKANTKPTYTASEVGAATAEDVYRIVAGTNVLLVVTNYNSAVHAPLMSLQHLDPDTGEYVVYWNESRRHGITLTNAMEHADAAVAAERARADAAYAPRAWSGTTSGLGAEAPAGVTWISTPETVIAGGYEYEKVVTSAGAVWVLASNGLTAGATTNGYFRIEASDGTELFSIEKTDSYLVGVPADGITRSGNTVTIPLNVVAPSHPYIRAAKNLVNAAWTKEDENGFACDFASVSWSGSSGAYVATVTCAEPQAFFYFEFLHEGSSKIRNSAATEMTGGIYLNGTTYMPTVNGNKLEFVAQ